MVGESVSRLPPSFLDGQYQVGRRLGDGATGSVYEAKHLASGRRVAIKVVAPESIARGVDLVECVRREAIESGATSSPHVAQILDAGTDPSSLTAYVVTELLVGEDLRRVLARDGRLAPDLALRIAAQACMGLEKAHAAGVVHRDVTPANLFLARQGGDVLVKLLDLGVAHARADPLTESGADRPSAEIRLGSTFYLSPERARGIRSIDRRSDVFSLGVLLYEAITGTTPHHDAATLGDLVFRICRQRALPLEQVAPWVSNGVAALVYKATAIEPGGRFAGASEMLAALRVLLPHGVALKDADFSEPPRGSRPSLVPSEPRLPSESTQRASTLPSAPHLNVAGAEPMQRRVFVPAAKRAAALLWGDEGLNDIVARVDPETRADFLRVGAGDEWIATRHVVDWCLRTFEGPCHHDRNRMVEYVDRVFDLSYGVIRRFVLRLADPVGVVPRLGGFWRHDHTAGEMTAKVDASNKGCTLRLVDSPYTELPHSRAGLAETYRYAFAQTRARGVTESHALERVGGKGTLVIRIRWQ
jgi:serine/threonine protein kinase